MSWRDDLREQNVNEANKESEHILSVSRENDIKITKIDELWQVFIKANNALYPEIKLHVYPPTGVITGIKINGIIRGKVDSLYLISHATEAASIINAGELNQSYFPPRLNIIFDIKTNKLVASYWAAKFNTRKELKKSYRLFCYIDDNTVDILFRNMCAGKPVDEGLVPYGSENLIKRWSIF